MWCPNCVTTMQEIAAAIARVTQRMCSPAAAAGGGGGDRAVPYQVIARFHRKFIDVNRSTHKVRKCFAHSCVVHA